ncbi:MAG: hypothetical protein H6922_00845 [Pseudomonadaceae bacterium]|nr:hypothetical protein [Pseudomonadaceae bacterium]
MVKEPLLMLMGLSYDIFVRKSNEKVLKLAGFLRNGLQRLPFAPIGLI